MTSATSFRSILLALSVGALGTLGCVLTVGEVDCSTCDNDPLCHSEFNSDGDCVCEDGYTWEDEDASNNFECDREDPKPGTGDCGTDPNAGMNAAGDCICLGGTSWCSNDPSDLTCCDMTGGSGPVPDPTTGEPNETDPGETDPGETDDPTTGADSTGGNDTNNPADLPECTAELENAAACTNNGDASSVEGSEAFLCQGGEWSPIDMDAECEFAGSDFAYGCYFNDADEVAYECGDGPGTDCTDADDACDGDVNLSTCLFGKLTTIDCFEFCTGDEAKVQCDEGVCDGKSLSCFCSDEGGVDCP